MTVIEVQEYLQTLYNFNKEVSYGEQDYRVTRAYEDTLDLLNHPTNRTGGMEGTQWAAYNAVTYYIDHERKVQGEGELSVFEQEDKRRDSSWFGRGEGIRQKAYALLLMQGT